MGVGFYRGQLDGGEVGIHDCHRCVISCHRKGGKVLICVRQLAMTRGVGEKGGQICLTANVAQSCVTEGGEGKGIIL